jgi:hypothetical protein
MTIIEIIKRDEQTTEALSFTVCSEDELLPPSITPAIVEGNRKRARKHTAVYREAFGDSQDDPTADIKRGKTGGIL